MSAASAPGGHSHRLTTQHTKAAPNTSLNQLTEGELTKNGITAYKLGPDLDQIRAKPSYAVFVKDYYGELKLETKLTRTQTKALKIKASEFTNGQTPLAFTYTHNATTCKITITKPPKFTFKTKNLRDLVIPISMPTPPPTSLPAQVPPSLWIPPPATFSTEASKYSAAIREPKPAPNMSPEQTSDLPAEPESLAIPTSDEDIARFMNEKYAIFDYIDVPQPKTQSPIAYVKRNQQQRPCLYLALSGLGRIPIPFDNLTLQPDPLRFLFEVTGGDSHVKGNLNPKTGNVMGTINQEKFIVKLTTVEQEYTPSPQ